MVTARPAILFAPGAGAASSSPWMSAWRDRLATIGDVETLRDYPYRLAGRKAPDKLPVLIASHREALHSARVRHAAATSVVLVGKSMGGRVGCHVAVAERDVCPVDAVICLGYPLRASGGAVRDEVLLALRTPVLFVQGTRDPLCPLELLAGVREGMTAPNDLLVVEGGNHSLEVPKKRRGPRREPPDGDLAAAEPAQPPQDAANDVMQAICDFLDRVLPPRPSGEENAPV